MFFHLSKYIDLNNPTRPCTFIRHLRVVSKFIIHKLLDEWTDEEAHASIHASIQGVSCQSDKFETPRARNDGNIFKN